MNNSHLQDFFTGQGFMFEDADPKLSHKYLKYQRHLQAHARPAEVLGRVKCKAFSSELRNFDLILHSFYLSVVNI